jgi:hypothetical protein
MKWGITFINNENTKVLNIVKLCEYGKDKLR